MNRSDRIEAIIKTAVNDVLSVMGDATPIRAKPIVDRRVGRPSPNRLLDKTDLPDGIVEKLNAIGIRKVGQLVTYYRDTTNVERKKSNLTYANSRRIKEFLGE